MGIFINNLDKRNDFGIITSLQKDIDDLLLETNDPTLKSDIESRLQLLSKDIADSSLRKGDARKKTIDVLNDIKNEIIAKQQYNPQYVTPAKGIALIELWDPEKYTKSYITKSGSEEKDTRVKHFADYLYNQLYPAYLTLSDDSKTLSGWNTKNNKNLHDWLEKLYISKNSPTDLDVSIEQMGDIINALEHSELKDAYESTFAPWLVGFDAYEQQLQQAAAIKAANTVKIGDIEATITPYYDSNAAQLMKDAGWKVYKGTDGNWYTDQANSQLVVLDPTKSNYKHGVVSIGNKLYYGNLDTDSFHRLIAARSEEVKQAIRNAHIAKYGEIRDYGPQGGKRGIDLSNYMTGSDVYFLDLGDTDPLFLPYESLGLDWRSKFNWEGNTDVSATDTDINNQYINSIGGAINFGDIQSLDEETAKNLFSGAGDESGDINTGNFLAADPIVSEFLNILQGQKYSEVVSQFVADYLRYAYADDQDKAVIKLELISKYPTIDDEYKNPRTMETEALGDIFMDQLQQDKSLYKSILKLIISDPNYNNIRPALVQEWNGISSKKEGGLIIKMLEGNKTFRQNTKKDKSTNSSGKQDTKDWTFDADTLLLLLNPEQKKYIYGQLASLGFDILGMFAGPIGGAAAGIASMGADSYAYANMPENIKHSFLKQAGIQTLNGLTTAASLVPFIGNKTKSLNVALAASAISKGLAAVGVPLSVFVAGMGFKGGEKSDIVSGFEKMASFKFNTLTPNEITALTSLASAVTTGTMGIKSAKRVSDANVVNETNKVWVKTVGPDGKLKAVQVDKSKIDDAVDQPFWQWAAKTRKNRIENLLKQVPKGHTVVTGPMGKPKTRPVYEVDYNQDAMNQLEAMKHRMSQQWQYTRRTDKPWSTNEPTYNKLDNLFHSSGKSQKSVDLNTRDAIDVKVTQKNKKGQSYDVYTQVAKIDDVSPDVLKLYHLTKTNYTDLPPEIQAKIPATATVYSNNTMFVYTNKMALPAANNKVGGKLNRLNIYFNSKK